MKRRYLLFFLLFLGFIHSVDAQNAEKQKIIEQLIEAIVDENDDETDKSLLLEDLERLIEHPLDLNNASRSSLEKLPFLTSFQIENLLAYREKQGSLLTINELLAVDGFTPDLIETIGLFTFLSQSSEVLYTTFRHEINFRTQFITSESDGTDIDSLDTPKMLLKYRAQKGEKIQLGFTAETDRGEDFFRGSNSIGFDFYSGFVKIKGKNFFDELVIGDFQWASGQGLVHGMGFGSRKTAGVSNIRLVGQGFRGSTSVDENAYMRGVAASFSVGDFDISTFISSNKVDANISETDSMGKTLSVSSLQTTGYHITDNELANENSLLVTKAGGNVVYSRNRFRVGTTLAYQHFGALLEPTSRPYNTYYFRGNNNYNLSTDFLWVHHKFNLFGEAAISQSNGKAALLGLEAQPSNRVSISVLARNYAKNYHSIGGNAFGEWGNVGNEQGVYAGIMVLPMAKTKLSAYFDSYSSHWMRFNSNYPVKGTDYFVQAEYALSRKANVYLRYRSETKTERQETTSPIKQDIGKNISKLRIHADWQLAQHLALDLRAEWAGYQMPDSTEKGILLFTGLSVTSKNNLLAGTFRVAWFNTDSYNTRIYAFENDMPQSFYIPSYYGNGYKVYAQMRYKVSEKFTAYLKCSGIKTKNDKLVVGAEPFNQKTEVKLHLKYSF